MLPVYYHPVYLLIILVFCIIIASQYLGSNTFEKQEEQENIFIPIILCAFLTFWLGFRNIYSAEFGDTVNYRRIYELTPPIINWNITDGEGLWELMLSWFKAMRYHVSYFFTFINFLYFFTALWAVKLFFPKKPLLGLFVILSSLICYSFGVNGIRNGLACHIMLLSIAYLLKDKYVLGVAFSFAAFFIHKSTIIPIMSLPMALWIIKKPQTAIYLWLGSIVLSLLIGNAAIDFFASLNFDKRMEDYGRANAARFGFSSTGFRWDFIMYSALPILLWWYVAVKRNIQDNWYNTLGVIYCLSNSVWILVIRASFSNRFAYLSWFMYPIFLMYPFLYMPVWNDQDKRIGYVVLGNIAFTLFMEFMVWGLFDEISFSQFL